jgi:hypothetical protein
MFNVTIGPDDQVIVCVLVGTREFEPVPGSVEVPCAECNRMVWRSTLPPVAGYNAKSGRFQRPPVGAPEPNIVLCLPCARMHAAAGL